MERSDRILDAARELLLTFGYRKVTIDDVARRAGVGKGTVYLHWSSKAQLFSAVLAAEAAEVVRRLRAELRVDPAEARPHRLVRTLFLAVMERPLARAVYTGDSEILGALLAEEAMAALRMGASQDRFTARCLELLHEHGLLADDPAADPGLTYRFSAVLTGFFLLESLLPAALDPGLIIKADAVATTFHRGFEPATEPPAAAVATAAKELTGLYDAMLAISVESAANDINSQEDTR